MSRHHIPLLVLFALIAPRAESASSAEQIADALENRWYEIEFFVFERSAVQDFNTREALVRNGPRHLPAAIRTMRPGDEGYEAYYEVDPMTALCLTYPTLEYRLKPADEPGPDGAEDPGTDAEGDAPEVAPVVAGDPLVPEPAPSPQLEFEAALRDFEAALVERSERWLPPGTFALAREARRTERLGIGRVLLHGRWLQALPPRDTPAPILIQAGTALEYPVAVRELVGSVDVTVARYLHFNAELFYHLPLPAAQPIDLPLGADGRIPRLSPLRPAAHGYLQLSESRRMRSGEVHYLDHPKLGIVARIDPVEIPSFLVDALERLEEADQ